MKRFRKLVSMAIAICLVCAVNTTAWAEDNDEADIRKQVIEQYEKDSEFQKHMAADPKSAYEMIDTIVSLEIQKISLSQSKAGDASHAYCNVPLITQIENYTCGPTSALQALYASNVANKVSGGNNTAKLKTLASEMGSTSANGTLVYRVTNGMNKYISSGKYVYVGGATKGKTWVGMTLTSSLVNNRPPILHARTEYLSYYGGRAFGHYIAVSDSNRNTDEVTVVDCTYLSAYNGEHTVSLTEAYNSIAIPSDRYLIYG